MRWLCGRPRFYDEGVEKRVFVQQNALCLVSLKVIRVRMRFDSDAYMCTLLQDMKEGNGVMKDGRHVMTERRKVYSLV